MKDKCKGQDERTRNKIKVKGNGQRTRVKDKGHGGKEGQ